MVKALKEGKISRKEKVVVLVTGNGLKDIDSAKKAGGEVLVINPNLKAVKEAMK
jgi:threonine synthase